MLSQRALLSLIFIPLSGCLGDSVYVVANNNQFGTLNLASGSFHQIGPNTPEGEDGLAPEPSGSLLTLTYSGNLDSINPASGVTTVIGPTGLGDCTLPTSPCGSNSANSLVRFGNNFYATDLANNLYTVNPSTAAAKLVGPTGIPPLPFKLQSTNPDGSTNVVDQAFFSSGGKLYATFDAAAINFSTSQITPVIPDSLYQIDPSTGVATRIGPTTLNLKAAVDVGGTVYAFDASNSEVLTLDLMNGNTTFFSNVDPAAGLISGASPTPEPSTYALIGLGLVAAAVCRRRRLPPAIAAVLSRTKPA